NRVRRICSAGITKPLQEGPAGIGCGCDGHKGVTQVSRVSWGDVDGAAAVCRSAQRIDWGDDDLNGIGFPGVLEIRVPSQCQEGDGATHHEWNAVKCGQ